MERLTAAPAMSVPKACNGWGEAVAPYRFFDNDGVDWRAILEPHWRRTRARGLGPLSYEAQRGMYLHPTYAVTPAREPLGVLDAWMWAREEKDASGRRAGRRKACAGSKVTNAWQNWRRICLPLAWSTWPTARRT